MPDEPAKRTRQRADALLNETASDANEPGIGARKRPAPPPPEEVDDGRTRKFPTIKAEDSAPPPPPPAEEEENAEIMSTMKLEPYRPSPKAEAPPQQEPAPPPAPEEKKTGRFKTGPAITRELTTHSSESTREISRDEAEAYGLHETAWFGKPDPEEAEAPEEADRQRTARFVPIARTEEPAEERAPEPAAPPEPPAAEDDRQSTARFVALPRTEEKVEEPPPPEPVVEAVAEAVADPEPVVEAVVTPEPEPAAEAVAEEPEVSEPEPEAVATEPEPIAEPEAAPEDFPEEERQKTARFVPIAPAETEPAPEQPPATETEAAADEEEVLPLPPREPEPSGDEAFGEKTARYVPPPPKAAPPAEDDRQKTARFVAAKPDPSLQEISGEKTARFVPPSAKKAPPAEEDDRQKTARFVAKKPEVSAEEDDRQKTARFVARPADPGTEDDERKKTARINLGDLSNDERDRIAKAREEYLNAAAKKLEERRKAAAKSTRGEEDPHDEGKTAMTPLPKSLAELRDASSMIEAKEAGEEKEPPPPIYSEAALPDEAPDEPAEKPVRLTKQADPDTVDLTEQAEPKPKRRIGAKPAWILAGSTLGIVGGLSLHFMAGMTLPFIDGAPKTTIEDRRLDFHPPEGAKDPWVRRERRYVSVGEGKLHLFDSDAEKIVGEVNIPETAGKPTEAALIGVVGGPILGDLTLAWPDANTLRWKRVELAGAEAEAPLIEKPSTGNVEMAPGSVGRFAPVAIEDWGRAKTERLLASERRKETKEDALRIVDPVSREVSEAALELGGRLLAPPTTFYDPETRTSFALAVASSGGKANARLFKLDGLKISEAGEAIALPWAGNCPVVAARARFGAAPGWIVAQRGAAAGVAFVAGKLELRGSAGQAPDGGEEVEPPPIIATFPNHASPTHDSALVIDASDEGDLASGDLFSFSPVGATAEARLDQLPSPGDGIAAADFNGDGNWDIVALNKRSQSGAAWLLDGKTLKISQLTLPNAKGEKPPPVQSRIAWSIAPGASDAQGKLTAFFTSKESIGGGDAATIAIKRSFTVEGRGWKWIQGDFEWRNGQAPFLAGAKPGAAAGGGGS